MAVFTTLAAIGAAVGVTGATASIVAGGAIAGAAAYGATKLFKGAAGAKGGATPSLTPLPAAPSIATAELSAKEDIAARRRSQARNQTTYTSPLGLSPQQKSEVALKTLTGQ